MLVALGGAHRYRHLDFRGNVKFVSDAAGDVVAHYRYAPFGLDAVFGADDDPVRFVARPEIGELMLLGARVYDPAVGRFLSPDPLFQIVNQFAYTLGNPVWFSDADGFSAEANSSAQGLVDGLSLVAAALAVVGRIMAFAPTPQTIIIGNGLMLLGAVLLLLALSIRTASKGGAAPRGAAGLGGGSGVGSGGGRRRRWLLAGGAHGIARRGRLAPGAAAAPAPDSASLAAPAPARGGGSVSPASRRIVLTERAPRPDYAVVFEPDAFAVEGVPWLGRRRISTRNVFGIERSGAWLWVGAGLVPVVLGGDDVPAERLARVEAELRAARRSARRRVAAGAARRTLRARLHRPWLTLALAIAFGVAFTLEPQGGSPLRSATNALLLVSIGLLAEPWLGALRLLASGGAGWLAASMTTLSHLVRVVPAGTRARLGRPARRGAHPPRIHIERALPERARRRSAAEPRRRRRTRSAWACPRWPSPARCSPARSPRGSCCATGRREPGRACTRMGARRSQRGARGPRVRCLGSHARHRDARGDARARGWRASTPGPAISSPWGSLARRRRRLDRRDGGERRRRGPRDLARPEGRARHLELDGLLPLAQRRRAALRGAAAPQSGARRTSGRCT